jgi:hypothetical protein
MNEKQLELSFTNIAVRLEDFRNVQISVGKTARLFNSNNEIPLLKTMKNKLSISEKFTVNNVVNRQRHTVISL